MIAQAGRAGAVVERRDGATVVEVAAAITTTLGGLRIDGSARAARRRVRRGRRRRRHLHGRLLERAGGARSYRDGSRRRLHLATETFTIGVEEELLLVERDTYALSHTSTELIEAMGEDELCARQDLYEAQVELSSRPRGRAAEAVAALPACAARCWRPAGRRWARASTRRPRSATCASCRRSATRARPPTSAAW